MKFEDIHGTDRRFFITVDGKRKEDREFMISGYGITSPYIKKEKRFHRWITIAPTISFRYEDESF